MTPTLSVCMLTRGPAARVRAVLATVRDAADEIVVAVDRSAGEETRAACAEIADRCEVIEVGFPARAYGWLQHQCRCDWLLRLDDDEIPSAALLRELPSQLGDPRPTHIALSRRWVFPDTDGYIATHPWTPDYQVRLMRNLPGLWSFPTERLHGVVQVAGERRLADLPLLHLDLLLSSPEDRREKRERYERARPAYENEGTPVNAMYTPEDVPAEIAELPAEDGRAVADVLAAVEGAPAAEPGGLEPTVPGGEVERHYGHREVGPGAYRARIEFARPAPPAPPDAVRTHELVVENLGDETWPPGEEAAPPIRLGYRWLREDGGEVRHDGPRTPFTETVEPGRATRVLLATVTPRRPGRYLLEVDVVHEHVRWFGCAVRRPVDVVS